MAIRNSVRLFGARIDCLTMPQAVDQLFDWIGAPIGRCRYVVTPNVDHVVLLEDNAEFRRAYSGAALVLIDGWPVQWAARLLKGVAPPRVPGSDLTPAMLAAAKAKSPLKVFLLGAAPGVATRAAGKIHRQYEAVEVVGCHSPALGFEKDAAENQRIVSLINSSNADLLIIGLGAPKQELWIERFQDQITTPVAVCVGATIDFLAGEKKRAPQWIQRLGLEWLHRMCSEPKRLVKRYSRDAVIFPRLMLKEWRSSRSSKPRTLATDQSR